MHAGTYIMNDDTIDATTIDNINVDELLKSLESDKLLSVSKLSYDKINTIKYNVLARIGLEDDELESMLLKLSDYRYVEELQDIHHGAFVRYIPLTKHSNKCKGNKGNKDNDIIMKPGGFICDIKILGSGVQLLCRNHFRKMFQLRLDEVLLFQKLTKQEEIILSVFDYLNKK
jgi:hypothetical protein